MAHPESARVFVGGVSEDVSQEDLTGHVRFASGLQVLSAQSRLWRPLFRCWHPWKRSEAAACSPIGCVCLHISFSLAVCRLLPVLTKWRMCAV
jgi:hypothetical protein